MSPHDALRRYPLLAALGPDRLGPWLASAQPIAADFGETLFQAGTSGEHVYLVEEGRVRVLRPGKGGREISLGAYGPGDLFGEYALLRPGNNTATCRISGAARLLRMPLDPLRDAVAARPALRDRLKAWLRLHAALGYLRDGPYLGFLSAPAVLQLVDHFQAVTFPAGHAIQAEGLSADRLYLIRNGEVVIERTADNPGDTMLLRAGECFGAEALLGEAALPLAEARTEVECLALGRAAFDGVAAGSGTSVQTFQFNRPVCQQYAWVAQAEATDCGLACLAMVARSHDLEVSLAHLRQRLQPGNRGNSLLELQRAAEGLGLRARAVRIGPDHLAALALPAVAHLIDGHYVVVYAVSASEVVAGDPAKGIVTLELAAFRHSWSGHTLLVVRPGDTAVLQAPVGPLPQAIMTPHSSFDTLQLHSYLDHLRADDREATDAFLRRICGRLERLARRMLRDFPNVRRWADTGDVLQGALMRLLHTLQATQPESTRHFANLAALHIRRELLDLARHYRNRLDLPLDTAELPDPNSTRADELDLWSAFHEQVDQLPAEEREVVGLTFYHGWTQAQVAELFEVDERTVRRRWRSAAVKLSEALGHRLPQL